MTNICSTTSACAPTQDPSTQAGHRSKSFPLAPADCGWAWTQTLKLPSLPFPPSVNHYWVRNRNGGLRVSAEGKAFREAVMWKLKNTISQPMQGMLAVDILVSMPDRRRRDLDNLMKAALDALTAAGVWLDDSQIADLRIRKSPVIGGWIEVTVWR